MGLTLIEAAKYENRLEHLAVLKTFSEGELLAQLSFMNIACSGLLYSAEQELPPAAEPRAEAWSFAPISLCA